MSGPPSERARHARRLFAGIAQEYGWMGAVLSLGQDVRWRRFLVDRLEPLAGRAVLDVASGTGLVARELARRGARVIQLDPSEPMLRAGLRVTARQGLGSRIRPVLGLAEALPFPDGAFDALAVTYLLRYVDDPAATIRELVRVVHRGGRVASLEFGVPPARWARACWRVYTRRVLPVAGGLVSPSWAATGRFLGPSIEAFERAYPRAIRSAWWRDAGLTEVRARPLSYGAAVVVWGRRG